MDSMTMLFLRFSYHNYVLRTYVSCPIEPVYMYIYNVVVELKE